MMTKQEARKRALEKRTALTHDQVHAATLNLEDKIRSILEAYIQSGLTHIMVYLAIPGSGEPDLSGLWHRLAFMYPAVSWYVPYLIKGKSDMLAALWHPGVDNLVTGPFKVPQPERADFVPVTTLDLVLAPALVTDAAHYRVGYGKGYYDRFLNDATPRLVTIAISYWQYPDQLLGVDPWDVPFKHILDAGLVW